MADNIMNGTNVPPGWTKNDRIKTCKCDACGDRVRYWSYKCNEDGRHICSECLDSTSNKTDYCKLVARDHIHRRCWCAYPGNMPPDFANKYVIPSPPQRREEESKAKAAKGLAVSNRKSKPSSLQHHKHTNISDDISDDVEDDVAPGSSDDDYNQHQSVRPTIAGNRAPREGLKRKNYQDGYLSDDVQENAASMKVKKKKTARHRKQSESIFMIEQDDRNDEASPLAHLHQASTVIVGAGIVGLFIARELALRAISAGIEHRIVVVELRRGHCELASGQCAGFLSTNGISEEWKSVANSSKQWWLDLISSGQIRERLDFDGNTKFQLVQNADEEVDRVPSWIRSDVQWLLSDDGNAIGRINSVALASWLFEQCQDLGIEFRFEHFVSIVDFGPNAAISAVKICQVADELEKPIEVICNNLVLAAGPFTTGIFNTLFANTPLELENYVQGSDWFHVRANGLDLSKSTAVRIPDAAELEERLDNEICMVTDAANNTIAFSGTTTHIRNKDLKPGLAKDPGRGKTGELKIVAAAHLDVAGLGLAEKGSIVQRGRSELSVANNMRPIIDRVPVSGIGMADMDEIENLQSSGVWLCYGFGKYGTLLAPGAAEVLISAMCVNDSDSIEVGDMFRLPEHVRPESKVVGKGKGKAS